MELEVVKISPQGQITIPQDIRNRYNLKPGRKAQIIVLDKTIEIRTMPDSWVSAGYGVGKGLWQKHGGVKKYHEKEKNSWDK